MLKISVILETENETENFYMKPKISIFPSQVWKTPISGFSQKRKKELLKFRWYVYYNFNDVEENKPIK